MTIPFVAKLRKRVSRWYLVPICVLLLGFLSGFFLYLNYRNSRMEHQDFMRSDILNHVSKVLITEKEFVEGFPVTASEEEIVRGFDDAIKLAGLLITGGVVDPDCCPVEPPKDPEFLMGAFELKSSLPELKAVALDSLTSRSSLERFNKLIVEFIDKSVGLEQKAEKIRFKRNSETRKLFRGLLVLWAAIVAVAAAGLFRLERRRMSSEEALRESEQRFRGAFENAAVGASMVDLNGRFVRVNSALTRMVGYSEEELLTKTFSDITYPEDIPIGLDAGARMVGGEAKSSVLEKRYIHKDGSLVHGVVSPALLRDEDGKPLYFLGLWQDVTERKKAEERLRLFSHAIEEAQDGIQIVGLDGRVMYSNKAVEKIYGFSPMELYGKPVGEMNEDPEFADKYILPAIKEYGFWAGELMVKHKNGRAFPIWLTASFVTNDKDKGRPIAMVGVIRDVTEKRNAEEQLQRQRDRLEEMVAARTAELVSANLRLQNEIALRKKMEEEMLKIQKLDSLGILAGGIAHDFNNFLTVILNNISLARLSVKTKGTAGERLEAAESACLRAQSVTRQLLTFSKGGLPVKRPHHFGKLLQESADFASRGLKSRMEFQIADDLWPVEADAGQISQVISNMIINADQSMPGGGIITIGAENALILTRKDPVLEPGRYVRITIEDKGEGIHAEFINMIFDPYFTTKKKGSGLGLTSAFSIVRKHDGHIAVESEPGAGTAFKIYLPASTRKPEEAEGSEPTGAVCGHFLLMEDEESLLETVKLLMESHGCRVTAARDGDETIKLFKDARDSRDPFDAVILDLTISGGMGGVETLAELRKIDPNVKAVVASGYSNDEVMSNFRAFGFDGVIPKPYKVSDLLAELGRLLSA